MLLRLKFPSFFIFHIFIFMKVILFPSHFYFLYTFFNGLNFLKKDISFNVEALNNSNQRAPRGNLLDAGNKRIMSKVQVLHI